jgi:hypothetical protein
MIATLEGAACPSAVFLAFWAEASRWDHVERHGARSPETSVLAELRDVLLDHDDGAAAATGLLAELGVQDQSTPDRIRGCILAGMQAIDEAALRIHPRAALLPPACAPRGRTPAWLEALRDRRALFGVYAEDETRRLLPRGPFSARARTLVDINGDTLEDRFAALTAAPHMVSDGERPIRIDACTIGHNALTGVPPRRGPPAETVGVVPIAESATDLVIERLDRNDAPHVRVGVADAVRAADRLFDRVSRLAPLDIAVAPELTMSEAEARRYAGRLSQDWSRAPRLSIAGSGCSEDIDADGRRRNLSLAFNSVGTTLWGHAKIWPYGMNEAQVRRFGWPDIKDGTLLMEDLAPGDRFTVADIDGLGRVITLICQDFQIAPAVADAIRIYQPDWVVVPILDDGVDLRRWPHVRAFRLSDMSQARFIIASSLSLADQAGANDLDAVPIGLLVGPQTPVADPPAAGPRAVGVIRCSHADPRCGALTWGDGGPGWGRTDFA